MQGGRLERTLEMTIMIRALNQTTGAFSGVRLAAMAAIGAIGAGLAYSAKQAADFQQGLTTLVTGAGEAVDKLQQVGDGIKQVSIQTGTTTDDLIKSMFLIESANFRGASGLQVLLTAAEGAKVGNTDLAKTTQVLLTMLHDYHQPASQAVADTNSIIATVKNGTMTMDDLNGALKNVLSIASAFHIKLSDVEAALATMSVAGDKGSAAGTHLAMMLRMLSNPATSAANEMAAMGINSVNVANEMRISLPLALQEIETAVARHFTPGSVEFNRAITTILGGTRSGVAGLELMNANLPIFRANAANAATAAATAGKDVTGWALVQQDFNQQLAQTRQALNVAAIDIGTILIPVLERALAWVTPLIAQFTHWVETSPDFQNAVNNVATAIGNLAQFVWGLVQDAVNLYQAFQQGQAWAIALAIALGTVSAAIALLNIAEFVAGIWQAVAGLGSLGGLLSSIVRYLMSTFFPSITIAITDLSIATGVSATAITATLAAATAGISLLIGAVIAAIAYAAVNGQNAMSQATKQAYDSLGQTSDDMKAKAQADATIAQVSWQAAADNTTSRWQNTGQQVARASADARAKYILDQQKMADAAEKAAQQADQAWTKASQDANIVALLLSQGWSPGKIKKYLAGSGTDTQDVPGMITVPNAKHHASGIMNSPTGHLALVGERGPELMYVPRGASIYPNGSFGMGGSGGGIGGGTTININVSTMAGSRAEVMRMVDLIETELASRFRTQTNSFSLRGVS